MLGDYINTITERLKAKGYTDADICRTLGINSRMTLHRWRQNDPPLHHCKFRKVCEKLAPLLGENVDVLFTNGLVAIRNYYIK